MAPQWIVTNAASMRRSFVVLFPLLALALAIAACAPQQTTRAQSAPASHPLDPLTAAEISKVMAALRGANRFPASARVVTIELAEPDKQAVLTRSAAAVQSRVARVVLYDWSNGATTELTVDLQRGFVASPTNVSTGDPPVRRMVIARATEIALADAGVVDALRKRGIVALDRVTFLGGLAEGKPLAHRGAAVPIEVIPWVWDPVGDGAVPRGLRVRVDLAGGTVENLVDSPFRAPDASAARPASDVRPLKPLNVSQPEGPSFRLEGSQIEWDRWRLHFDVHPRRGLELFDVSLADGSGRRPVLYRASLSELITPYGDPRFSSWYPRDAGDYGMTAYSGARANAIVGADAPAYAAFAPAVFANDRGQPIRIDRAVAIYERDGGVLWRHGGDGRRARQLVLSGYATIDNYDYLVSWIFGQDGAIDVQVQLTGVMNIRPDPSMGDSMPTNEDGVHYAHRVAPGILAPNHQHFFCWRLDLDIDGASNRVVEWNTANAQPLLHDTVGEWFAMQQRMLPTEAAARRDIDGSAARRWVVINGGHHNALGQPTAYALVPGENAPPFPAPGSAPRRRAAFLDHHLWVTLFDPRQVYASGEWVNLMREGEGVAAWSAADRSIVDRDIVLWYTFAVTHLPRTEDWPVMPAHTAGFRLVPVGFFSENPTRTK
jgi:primary-amine oxidase